MSAISEHKAAINERIEQIFELADEYMIAKQNYAQAVS